MNPIDNIMVLADEYAKATHYYKPDRSRQLQAALRAAIEQALEQGEPVVWDEKCVLGYCGTQSGCEGDGQCRANTAPPPQREWVGLTDVEWMNIVNKNQAWFGMPPDEVAHEVCKLTEAKLKEKNGGVK